MCINEKEGITSSKKETTYREREREREMEFRTIRIIVVVAVVIVVVVVVIVSVVRACRDFNVLDRVEKEWAGDRYRGFRQFPR
jgi:ABC-type phosphate transport system permease subunit